MSSDRRLRGDSRWGDNRLCFDISFILQNGTAWNVLVVSVGNT